VQQFAAIDSRWAAIRVHWDAEGGGDEDLHGHRYLRQLETVEPKVAQLLKAAQDDLLTWANFPEVHWSQVLSNNLIERLHDTLDDVPPVEHEAAFYAAANGPHQPVEI
jgi:hypothetical protein